MKKGLDKTKIAYASAYTSAAFIMLEISMWLSPLAKTSRLFRYFQQLTYIIMAVFGLLAIRMLLKLIPASFKRAFWESLLGGFKKSIRSLFKISDKLFASSETEKKSVRKNRDEKRFIFGRGGEKNKNKDSEKSAVKFRDMTENEDKIRFIYSKYITRKIKDGYQHAPVTTPNEAREQLCPETGSVDYSLFDFYNGARYSGGSFKISDTDVENALTLVKGKAK